VPPEVTRGIDPSAARRRVVIERLQPEIDGGRFPIKRTSGEWVTVTVDAFADGHDLLAGVLKYRKAGRGDWTETPLKPLDNDAWTATFTVDELGTYEYTIEAWIDRFGSWLKGLIAKADAGQDVSSELLEGAELLQAAAQRNAEGLRLLEIADVLRGALAQEVRVAAAREPELRSLMDARPDRSTSTEYARVLEVTVDPVRARFGAWYEMFPRSYTPDPSRSATFREASRACRRSRTWDSTCCISPDFIQSAARIGKVANNSLTPEAGDLGSPWANRIRGRRSHRQSSLAWDDRGLRSLRRHGPTTSGSSVALDIAFPGVARSSVGPRASPNGSSIAPTDRSNTPRTREEVSGHLPARLRQRRLAVALAGTGQRLPVLGVARREDLPRR
jgi:starch synthase (maltosyl-transferring)